MPFVGKLEDFAYSPADSGAGIITRSPVAFVNEDGWWIARRETLCDGQSVPRILWAIVGHPLENESIRASVLHDRYYCRPDGRTKPQIDTMFYEALIADGVGKAEAQAKYRAVKWFGWFAWRAHRRRDRS